LLCKITLGCVVASFSKHGLVFFHSRTDEQSSVNKFALLFNYLV
jgi:hypothetical protein